MFSDFNIKLFLGKLLPNDGNTQSFGNNPFSPDIQSELSDAISNAKLQADSNTSYANNKSATDLKNSSIFNFSNPNNAVSDFSDFGNFGNSDLYDFSNTKNQTEVSSDTTQQQTASQVFQVDKNAQATYTKNPPVELNSIPKKPENFEWHLWWGNPGTDLRGNDASNLDLSQSEEILKQSNFDTNTKFPSADKMPKNFNPAEVLENGKNSGLGVQKLHEEGITGKGVNIAVIDLPMNAGHNEFKDNIIDYENVGTQGGSNSEMHGFATTSIAAGKTSGVAPGSKVAYYATKLADEDPKTGMPIPTCKYMTQALDKILEKNKNLSESDKIKAVSLSWGADGTTDPAEYKALQDSVKQLEDSGVFVMYNRGDNSKFNFAGLDKKDLQADPDNPSSYKISAYYVEGEDKLAESTQGDSLLIPAGHRTTAAPSGENDYVNYTNGGNSWQIPYIVGAYALAKQVKPSITSEEFRQKAMESGTPYYSPSGRLVGKIINPEKLIEELKNKN